MTPPRAQSALEAGRDMAFLSKNLVTIRTDIPLAVEWSACAVHQYDTAPVLALFDRLEFRSIRHRLPPGGIGVGEGVDAAANGARSEAAGGGKATAGAGGGRATGRPAQLAMFPDDAAGAADGGEPAAAPADITATTIVRDAAALGALTAALRTAPIIAFDTGDDGDGPAGRADRRAVVRRRRGAGWYVPVGHAAGEQVALADVVTAVRGVLEDPSRPKVSHNAKYDIVVLSQVGIEVRGLVYDTMLAEFLIDPGGRLGLKTLAGSKLGVRMTEISALIGTGRKQITMDEVPIEDAAPYAAADADVTLRLMHAQAVELDAVGLRPLLDEVDVPLVPVLSAMERAGVLIDAAKLGQMSERLGARLREIEDDVRQRRRRLQPELAAAAGRGPVQRPRP
ncbi:MAG: hypothetical protein U0470_08440 [Anaerolineae bacterium]